IYADLDNDGDLDIVVNNINAPATLLKNKAVDHQKGDFLKVSLKGPAANQQAIGAKITLSFADGTQQSRQHIATRGYLSSVADAVHFGFKDKSPQQLDITWPDGTTQIVQDLPTNQSLEVTYQGEAKTPPSTPDSPLFTKVDVLTEHQDPYFNDYQLQVLLPHKLSQTGPCVAKADVNQDGLIDLYIGGGHRQAGQLLLGNRNGKFSEIAIPDFQKEAFYEDQSTTFLDADGDGDQDLYVVSGSYEFFKNPIALQDRLYLNDGKGNFQRAKDRLPTMLSSGAIVVAADYDQDGDPDLLVGGRVIPGKYPYPPKTYLLQNEDGYFVDATAELAPSLSNIGMVTGAVWADLNQDNQLDVILTGEWMGIEVLLNQDGQLKKSDDYDYLAQQKGWWNKLKVTDVDADGDLDIIAGNLGLNSKFQASADKPFRIYTDDFDANGSADILLAKECDGKEVPIRGKTCMTQQMPYLANRVKTYAQFANSELSEIVGTDLSKSLNYEVTEFRSGIFINNGTADFTFQPLPNAAQVAPVNSIVFSDFDGDQLPDLLVAGNNYHPEVETTRADAGISTLLKGDGSGQFSAIANQQTGLFLDGDVRALEMITVGEKDYLVVVFNGGVHELYEVQ
ncbi:MAG: FG-GAP-like repeat-containing protein, partial [Bacteroidota bacterium]